MSYCNFVSSLERNLARLGIYDTSAPGIAAELGAYEAGLAPLEELMDKAFGNFFVLTADDETLREKESLIRAVSELTEEARREFLMSYGRKDNFDLGNDAALLTMAGIEGKLTENYGGDPYKLGLSITSVVGSNQEAAVARLKELLPLHLELVVI